MVSEIWYDAQSILESDSTSVCYIGVYAPWRLSRAPVQIFKFMSRHIVGHQTSTFQAVRAYYHHVTRYPLWDADCVDGLVQCRKKRPMHDWQ